MAKFGLTWWGQKWLNSLTHIDYDNRLPRGRAYAGNGSVRSITINKNLIQAKVKGSRPSPYQITIKIPEFSENSKSILVDKILDNEYLLTKLLNRELPEELFEIANANKIKIFPESWQSFAMHCSCPDWAVPCKHLAAVIYIIANEIDKNPFLAFELKNFNILEEISKINNIQVSKSEEKITTIDDIFTPEETKIAGSFNEEIYKSIDFTTVKDIKDDLLSLLNPSPIFYEKDFKAIIESVYKSSKNGFKKAKIYPKIQNNLINIDFKIQLIINDQLNLDKIQLISEKQRNSIDKIDELINSVESIESKNISDYSDEVIAIYLINLFCKRLIETSGFIPQLIKVDEDEYRIRWISANINNEINDIFNQLITLTPSNIVSLRKKEKKKNVVLFQNQVEQLFTICSLFLDYYLKLYSNIQTPYYSDSVLNLFFTNKPIKFNEFSKKQVPNSIQIWLNKFHISIKDFAPLIKVEESDSGFNLSVMIENRKDSLKEPIALHKFISGKNTKELKYDILKDLVHLSEHFPDLKELINSNKKTELHYSPDEFIEILIKVLPSIKLFGLSIILPKSLRDLVKPALSMKIKPKKAKDSSGLFNLDNLLDFDWTISIGDELISIDEFNKLVKNVSGLVKYKDKYIYVDNSDLDKIYKNINKPQAMNGSELFKIAISNEYDGAKAFLDDEVISLIQNFMKTDKVAIPESLNANLRHYQVSGFEWLYKNSKLGFGSLIADDMGLGKTIQVITTLLKLKMDGYYNKKQSLVIVPTTLLTNWVNEIERFASYELKVSVYHGNKREIPKEKVDVLVTTYGTVRNDLDKLKKLNVHTLIIDEAQNIKNPDTEQTKAVKQLKADIKIAMSGTPVENRLSEYWSIFDFVNKGYLGSLKKFTDEYINPINQYKDLHTLEKFKKITAPFIIRRLKSDKSIISDLPDKIENNQICALSKEQTALYQKTVDNSIKIITESDGIERKGLVLKLLTSLKQICNHPNQFLKKANADPNLSGKMMLLFNNIENILEMNEKTLIFTQYKEMGELLVESIEKHFNINTLFLHGGLSRKNRDEMVAKFQESKSHKVFILSLKAGGTGLNLTAASNVIHYDLWWNPAVESQATDRAYRIGQKKNVMVYRLLTKGTIEDKIDTMLNTKKELANLTVTSGESWIGDLSNKDLKELVTLTN